MRGLRACFNHATQVFSLDLSHCLTRCVYLQTLSDGKLTDLKRLSVAQSWIDTEIMTMMLQRTCCDKRCLKELNMSDVSSIKDDVCKVITEFTSHSLEVLFLPERLSFWAQPRISLMLHSCQELVTLGVDGDIVDAQFIGDIFNGLELKKLRKLRLTDVKDTYIIKVLRTIHSYHTSKIELCICCCPYLRTQTTELLSSLRISLCSQCKYDVFLEIERNRRTSREPFGICLPMSFPALLYYHFMSKK